MANPGNVAVHWKHETGDSNKYNSNIISYSEVANIGNTSMNLTIKETTHDDLYQIEPGIVVLLSILYGSISAVTVLGNALVIVVVAKNRSMHTVTNFYIANLSFADVLIGVFSIPFQFQAALLQRWNLPHFLCPVAPFVKELTVNVSILTLAVISVDRFYAVIYPLKPKFSKTMAKILQASVWTFSLVSALPAAIVFRVSEEDNTPQCLANFPEFSKISSMELARAYHLYLVILQYFLPLVVICYAYFRIIHRVWLAKPPGTAVDKRDQILHKNKRKVGTIYILAAIMIMAEIIDTPLSL